MIISLRNERGELITGEAYGENFAQAIGNLLLQTGPSIDLFANYYLNAAEALEASGYDDSPSELAQDAADVALSRTGYTVQIVGPCYSII